MILNYKLFKTNAEFVQWQKDTSPHINQITPFVSSLEGGSKDAQSGDPTFNADTEISVFVVYMDTIPEDQQF